MKWSEIGILTTNEAIEPITNILNESGASGVVIEDPLELIKERKDQFGEIYELNPDDYPKEGVMIKSYLPMNSSLDETVDRIKSAISQLVNYDINIGKNEVTVSEVNEEEWATAWKKYYHPVKVSNRITVVPTWEDYTSNQSDELIIELDPGMAFGTGTHPTTVLSIQALERMIKPGNTLLDVGTGSGVLSIAAAKLGAKHIEALDLDEVAVKVAKENMKLNKVHDVVSVRQNDLLNGVSEEVDIVVANILAEVILRFVEDAYSILKKDGYFITSGIIESKRDTVKEAILKAGFTIEEITTLEDWVAIIAKK